MLDCGVHLPNMSTLQNLLLLHIDMGICAFCYICNLFGLMVFQRSMLDWRRGVHLTNMSTMCILLYMQLIWCNGFPEIYAQLEEGWGQSVMKLMQCSGLPEIYAWLWGVHLPNMSTLQNLLLLHIDMGICAFCYLWNLFGVMVFQRSMLDWRRGSAVNLP